MATDLKRVNGTLSITEEDKIHLKRVREVGKSDRKRLTDAIQAFNKYVDEDGNSSTQPAKAFPNYTRKIYAKRGLNLEMVQARLDGKVGRDVVSDTDLTYIQAAERMATKTFWSGMKKGLTRSDIKDLVNQKIQDVADVFADNEEELKA